MDDEATFVSIADRLAAEAFAVVPGFVAPSAVASLRHRALDLHAAGAFHPAAVGSGSRRRLRPDLRGDEVLWLGDDPAAPEQALLARLAALRLALNRELTLGLFEFECHYALYPPGAGYARHLDRFLTDARRVVSCIVYLNPDWTDADGGQLRLYTADGPRDILPAGGTLVAFLSDSLWHEVLPGRRPRLSLTGWFRRRA